MSYDTRAKINVFKSLSVFHNFSAFKYVVLGTNKTKDDYVARYKIWQVVFPNPNATIEKKENHKHFHVKIGGAENAHERHGEIPRRRLSSANSVDNRRITDENTQHKQNSPSQSEIVLLNRTDDYTCRGTYRRFICVYGLGDLGALTRAKHMFANKFIYNYSPLTSECLAEYIWAKVENEIRGIGHQSNLNLDYYKHLDFVKQHQ